MSEGTGNGRLFAPRLNHCVVTDQDRSWRATDETLYGFRSRQASGRHGRGLPVTCKNACLA